ncbi:hypothetical protein HNP37_004513 [Flavobacterium nitrogenifigens]|uniref:Alpha/beta hydrolase n=2 Tax=Flavobacterium TaxID=237 RepID=A0A7W7NAD3_9FLAO|nr:MULTISPECIES: hypothetical protein [Flavobacterium]MBB4804421.1 hypothetical protein [Flavobacterium nitrogenifigens]MBB6389451.1 hypothetical protein [Flavobacterium notoginsengisoli]
MQKINFVLLFLFAAVHISAQDIKGDWKGLLKVPGAELNLVVHITKSENTLTATLDSHDQKAFGIPVTSTTFENSTLKFTVENLKIEYEGILDKNQIITGTFKQMGQSFPLIFKR